MNPVQSSSLPVSWPMDDSLQHLGDPPGGVSGAAPASASRQSTNDGVFPAWYRRANPTPAPESGVRQDPFFAVIDKLIDRLDTMIGQLLGNTATPAPGAATPSPGDATPAPAAGGAGDGTASGDGTPIPAAIRQPLEIA